MLKVLEGYERISHTMNGPYPRLSPVALVCPYRKSAPSRKSTLRLFVVAHTVARTPFVYQLTWDSGPMEHAKDS